MVELYLIGLRSRSDFLGIGYPALPNFSTVGVAAEERAIDWYGFVGLNRKAQCTEAALRVDRRRRFK